MYPKSIQQLIECLKHLPGVGEKTAERYALAILDMSEEDVQVFATSLIDARMNTKRCEICGNYTDQDICSICADSSRNHKQIFVVQSPKDVIALEKTGEYHGLYHILNGLISTSKGVLPDDLNIDKLVERAKNADEIILGTNTTVDGETTAMYLEKLIHHSNPNVLITRIAHGLPTGGMLDYADALTLSHALEDRRRMNQ